MTANREHHAAAAASLRSGFCARLKTLPTCTSLQVEFKLLGFIPGSVGLRGKFVSIPEREGGENRKDTVKVRCGYWGVAGVSQAGRVERQLAGGAARAC